MGRIYWLASYPKSGNTWLRVFLSNYWRNGDQPASINDLDGGPIASARGIFDELAGLEASDLTPDEIDRYRPRVYEQLSDNSKEDLFLKVHDAFTRNAEDEPILSKAATAGVIYLIRNPLDVAVSFAHHWNQPVARMVDALCQDDYAIVANPKRLHNQFRQRLLSWSHHVCSWVDEPDLNLLVIRYEDMNLDAEATFTKIVNFAGLEVDRSRVHKALEFSRFERLQAQESKEEFCEKMPLAQSFFRKGMVGSWREILTEEQVEQLVITHNEVMQRFGYLSKTGDLIY
ncbi:sulfotransferase domain-containing protein [Synechococcales cyanobacterium C]|uniref:Sulfotransferase domain-containing protein n=1 Tax=Petrachloros mirabilis ULC683 TaxID=2781853 RepID=A0A8K1ZZK0_9CYAN|nr:sulfotransferase domain-containing protein [Petrachloros mirabilis]NCJ08054.1 sulfotransferase domain-containing protein [Petrachloros mirabilis ULC683]